MGTQKNPAVIILADTLTDGGKVYQRGSVEFNPSETLLACAEEGAKTGSGQRKAKVLTASERQKAAKKADSGSLPELLVSTETQESSLEVKPDDKRVRESAEEEDSNDKNDDDATVAEATDDDSEDDEEE